MAPAASRAGHAGLSGAARHLEAAQAGHADVEESHVGAVLEDQVVEHILENADISEIESSYEDILAGRAVPQAAASGEVRDALSGTVTSGEDV